MTCIPIFLALAGVAAAQAGPSTPPASGPKLHAAFAAGTKPTDALSKRAVDVTLVNKGTAPLLLDLGLMLGNGTQLLPTAIAFDLRNTSTGKKIRLVYAGSQPATAGRVDDFVVGLAPASAYQVRLSMCDFQQSGVSGPLALNGGSYVLTAVYDGGPASHVNSDMQGVGTLQFWQGTARSQGLPFKCAESKGTAPAAGGG